MQIHNQAIRVGLLALFGLLVVALFAFLISGSRCPMVLSVIGRGPSGVLDDHGNEFEILTVRISNTDSGPLTLAADEIRAEAKLGDHWVEAKSLSTVLDIGRDRDLLVLAPYNAEGCRLYIEYLPEPLHLKFTRACARLGLGRFASWRAVVWRCFPIGWRQPRRSDYVGASPHWKHICPEIAFPLGSRVRSDEQ